MLSEKEILNNIERHRAQPAISLQEYYHSLQKKLVDGIVGKRRVYLDTKYWVILRDAAMARPKSPIHTEILELLRGLVHTGAAICPLSDTAYVETMQQNDSVTRRATAALMDELSCGVAIATEQTRVRRELLNFVANPELDASHFNEKIWVKTSFVLGENLPKIKSLDMRASLLAQKSFVDLMWHQTVIDFAEQEVDRGLLPFQFTAAKINANMVAFAHEISSFKQAVEAEFGGCVKVFDRTMTEAALIEKGFANAKEEEIDKFQECIQRVLYNTMRLRPDVMLKRVPTLFIHTMCHAATRWDKTRKVNSHWLLDIHHACAGLAYHDVMFTEHPLRVLLESGNMQMDKKFSTPVLSKEKDVLHYLQSIR